MPIIVGVPRSGTTLLRMMLDAHPDVAVPPETGFLPSLADLPATADGAARASEIIRGFHTWQDFHLDDETWAAVVDGASEPAAIARGFYRAYAKRLGKPRWGDKTPTYGAEIAAIARLLPEAHFVHLIRDGRDVAVSVRRLWFRAGDTVEAIARDWATRIERTRRSGECHGQYLEVRYEALVTAPEATLRTICSFSDLAYTPAMLNYHRRASSRLDEHEALHDRDGRLIISKEERRSNQRFTLEPPRDDRVGRWKVELTRDEVRAFEATAGEWLDRLSYPRVASGVC